MKCVPALRWDRFPSPHALDVDLDQFSVGCCDTWSTMNSRATA
jgi:hypothetical protein